MSVIVTNVASLSLKAQGDINVSRFVKLAATHDHSALQAGDNDETIGISQDGSKQAPIPGASALAAGSGDSVMCFSEGDICLLELVSTVARAGNIKSDATGKGQAAATTGTTVQNIGAVALESGVSGERIKVKISRQNVRPALS